MIFKLGYLLFISLCFINDCFGIISTSVVQTKSGPVRGFYEQNALSGKWVASYLGIPYAKPPLGKRRFLPPVEIEKWEDVFEATKFGNICAQSCNGRFCGKKDCLYLNVYTPLFNNVSGSQKPKAVMVWIHGGAFIEGSGNSDLYGPDYLLDKDVILVTFNYRLGLFGFMNLGHELVPGNAGLKDQNMVLKWVKNNIAQFEGDPDNVTLFGQSAGAVAVDLHNIANMSKGLYARSIAMSGSVFCPWGFLTFEDAKKNGQRFVENVSKLRFSSTEEIVQFVLKAPTYKLIPTVQVEIVEFIRSALFAFAPSIEVVQSSEKFIDECHLEHFKKGLYHPGEHMMGFTSLETGFVSKAIANGANNLIGGIVNKLWTLINGEKLLGLHLLADQLFNAPIDLKHKYLTDYGSSKAIYYYYFSYLPKTSPAKGVAHSEDLQYVFYQKDNPHLSVLERTNLQNIDLDSVTRDRYVSLIANFAKTGKPSYDGVDLRTGEKTHFDWKISEKDGGYLNISNDLIVKDERPISSYAVNLQMKFLTENKRGAQVARFVQILCKFYEHLHKIYTSLTPQYPA